MIQSNVEQVKRKVLYAKAVYGDEEKQAVLKSLENGWLAAGPLVKEFEERVAKLFGKKYGIAVNSGSSANLLAIKALGIPKGSEVITPACTFATTVSEIVNNDLVPVFVDSVIGRYTINEDLVEEAITPKTKAILVPQLVGGICDMVKLREIADKHGIWLIDDSCDTFAPKFEGKTVASYADVTTTSFYGSHIITACGGGGMVLTDDEKVRDRVICLKDWGRVGNDAEAFENRFNFDIDGIPYDSKFLYAELGYNLKMNESMAAFGLEQLKKLPQFTKDRQKNFNALHKGLVDYMGPPAHEVSNYFYLPWLKGGPTRESETNWLAFPLTIKEDAPFSRYDLLKHLESNGIMVRVLFSGNITRHPLYKANGFEWRQEGLLPEADKIMAYGFLVGCHHGMEPGETDYVIEKIREFTDQYKMPGMI